MSRSGKRWLVRSGVLIWAGWTLRCARPLGPLEDAASVQAEIEAGEGALVSLWIAPIGPLEGRAVHPFFVYRRPGEPLRRIEVWQSAAGPWGHVQVDQRWLWSGVSLGVAEVARLEGEAALPAIEALEAAPERYPWRSVYLAWPGPNSNTFAAWALEAAGWEAALPPQAFGAAFPAP